MILVGQTYTTVDVMVSDVGLLVYEQLHGAPTSVGSTKILYDDDVVMMCAYLSVSPEMLRMTTWQLCIALVIPQWYDTDGDPHMLLTVVKESHDFTPGYYLVNVSNLSGVIVADVLSRQSNMPLRALRDHHVVITAEVFNPDRRDKIINAAIRQRQNKNNGRPLPGPTVVTKVC